MAGIPSNPKDLENIALVVEDISKALTMIEDRRSYINDAKKELKEQYELDAKEVTALIRWYHKQNVQEIQDQINLYEAVFDD